jgi:hypothetical protein
MSSTFYPRWIIANGWSEGVGLSATLLLGLGVAARLEGQLGVVTILAGAMLAVVLGTLLEGILVGFAQGRVLHRFVPALSAGRWALATAIGAGTAWLLGMVPSTIIALLQSAEGGPGPSAEPAAWVQYGLAALMGIVLGVVLALPQWFVLKEVARRSAGWLGANAVAWGVGMPILFVGMDLLPWGGRPVAIAAGVVAVCVITGAVVGAIHGVFLRRILSRLLVR